MIQNKTKQVKKKNKKPENEKQHSNIEEEYIEWTDRPLSFINSDATSLDKSIKPNIMVFFFKQNIVTRLEFSLTAGQREELSIKKEGPLMAFRISSWQQHL